MTGFTRVPDSSFGAGEQAERSILLYSTDLDFCISFRLLFQHRFHLATTTDVDMLLMTVGTMQPDVLIADAPLSARLQGKLALVKQRHPHLRIVLLYAPARYEQAQQSTLSQLAHAWFAKPINVAELIQCIDRLSADRAEHVGEDRA